MTAYHSSIKYSFALEGFLFYDCSLLRLQLSLSFLCIMCLYVCQCVSFLFHLSQEINTNFEIKFGKLMTAKNIHIHWAFDMMLQYIL